MHMAAIPGFFKSGLHTGRRRSPRQHVRDGICLAALRAFTGGEIYRARPKGLTLREVALRVGSGIHYVRAAVVLLDHGDQVLISQVLRGKCSIVTAAASVEALVKLVSTFKTATPETRAAFFAATATADLSSAAKRTEAASKLGPEVIWDEMVMPLISNGR
jgi:hypothetical protein